MREALRGYLAAGLLIGGCGLFLALFQPPGSPSYVVSLCSALIGGLLVVVVVVVIRMTKG